MKKLIIISTLISLIAGSLMPAITVYGAGNTTVNLAERNTINKSGYFDMTSNTNAWSTIVNTNTPRFNTAAPPTIKAGWYNSTVSADMWNSYWSIVSFNCTSILTQDIKDIEVNMKITAKANTYGWGQYYALYAGEPSNYESLAAGDGEEWWNGRQVFRLSSVESYADLGAVGDFTTFEISQSGAIDYILQDATDHSGICTLYLMTTHHAQKYAPTDSGLRDGQQAYCVWDTITMDVTYTSVPATRTTTVVANAAADNDTDGSENVTGISFGTPRLMYQDDGQMYLLVNGDSGAHFTSEVYSEDGTLFDTVTDEVRSDGNYDWGFTIIDYEEGFYRANASTTNNSVKVYSKWFYISESPASEQRTNDISSINTEYPQYTNEFEDYVVQDGDILQYHWKTNIDGGAGELADYRLTIRKNGSASDMVYNQILDDLISSYFEGDATNNAALDHWRFALFSIDDNAGWKSYDNLVINLNKALTNSNKGFYQPVILDGTDNTTVLTETVSSYWYLSSPNEGLTLSLTKPEFKTTENVKFNVNVGVPGKVSTYLPDFTAEVSGTNGSYYAGGTIKDGDNAFEISAIPAGSYNIKYNFSGSGVENFDYTFVGTVTVSTSGTSTYSAGNQGIDIITQAILNTMTDLGMNSTAGKILYTIILIVIVFFIFYRHEKTRVILPLMVFGFAIIMGWIPIWLVIILGLGAGFTIFRMFRRTTQGGG